MSYLKHYNHNHDALGRFASSNAARTIAGNESLIKANRDMSKTWNKYAESYEKKASKYNAKIEKKKAKNKDASRDEKKLKKIKEEGRKYSEYKSNAEMYAIRLEKENQKIGKEFSKLVENSIVTSIQRDNLNRITNVEYDLSKPEDIKTMRKFNSDLMSGKANTMTDEQILKKYRKKNDPFDNWNEKTDSQKIKTLKENRKNATDDDVRDAMDMEIYELEQKMKKKSK